MEIELGPLPRFEDVRYNAHWSRIDIDTRLQVYDFDNYEAHLKDCNDHPTVGLLARRKYITGRPMNYPIHARRNKKILENLPKIKELQESFKAKLTELYPRTKHIRQYIIDSERVKLDTVEPIRKYTAFNKLMIFFKRFI